VGDIGTHAEITAFVAGQVAASVPQVPAADYTYLELGNFLTDVSQFRDPVAFHNARNKADTLLRETAVGLPKHFGGPEWLRDVFGERSGPVHGALPELLRILAQAFAHELFDDDGLPVLGRFLGLVPGDVRPAVIPEHGLPPDRVDAVLAAHFTQYFPHEHLDFPPVADLPNHRAHPLFQPAPRGLIAYLEEFLRFISEELSRLEEDWVRARAAGLTAAQRQDFLVRLGHLLHPIEDYFFHSNLLEQYQWSEVRRAHPGADPSVAAGLRTLVDDGLRGTPLPADSVPLRRRLHRRLRYPVFDPSSALSAGTSDDRTPTVYTGGFGPTDVWHTLGGALEAMEAKLAQLPPKLDPRRTSLVLLRLLLSQSARRQMVVQNQATEMWKAHREQLRSGAYRMVIAEWLGTGVLCRHAAAELTRAFDHDLAAMERHKGWIFDFPGPGGVLILMLEQMQQERDKATAAARRLDADPATAYAVASANGCSAENVGTHSLLSKDSHDKEPMRPEAVAFAKHASAAIATRLLDRVYGPAPATEGLDWDALLAFHVRGVPAAPAAGRWEEELLHGVRGPATFRQPSVTDVREQPQVALLGPARDPARLAQRRAGTTRARLEGYYRGFESDLPA
jgi:hypothetical protein